MAAMRQSNYENTKGTKFPHPNAHHRHNVCIRGLGPLKVSITHTAKLVNSMIFLG